MKNKSVAQEVTEAVENLQAESKPKAIYRTIANKEGQAEIIFKSESVGQTKYLRTELQNNGYSVTILLTKEIQ